MTVLGLLDIVDGELVLAVVHANNRFEVLARPGSTDDLGAVFPGGELVYLLARHLRDALPQLGCVPDYVIDAAPLRLRLHGLLLDQLDAAQTQLVLDQVVVLLALL